MFLLLEELDSSVNIGRFINPLKWISAFELKEDDITLNHQQTSVQKLKHDDI
jgi:hypothetical protein